MNFHLDCKLGQDIDKMIYFFTILLFSGLSFLFTNINDSTHIETPIYQIPYKCPKTIDFKKELMVIPLESQSSMDWLLVVTCVLVLWLLYSVYKHYIETDLKFQSFQITTQVLESETHVNLLQDCTLTYKEKKQRLQTLKHRDSAINL